MATKIELPATQPERYYEQYERYGFEKTLTNNREIITPTDEKLIREFVKHRHATRGIGIGRQTKIGAILVYWKRYITKEYCDMTADDLVDGMSNFRNGLSKKGEPFKQNHQREMIVILKAFIRYLNSKNIINISEIQIKDIKNPSVSTDTDRAEDLFTADEIQKMVSACTKSSHKAFIYTSYETGARPAEIARLRWKDIVVNKNSIQITLKDTKTKKERTAFLIAGKEYLLRHATDLSDINLEDFIFKSSDNKPLNPHNAYNIVYNAKVKAGIKKHLKLKLFRKSRVSNMMKEGYNDGAIRDQIWGNQGTTMFKVYAKYDPKDIENAMLAKAGIEIEDEQIKEAQTKPRKCHVCGKSNEPDAKWCPQCGNPLTDDAIADANKFDAVTDSYNLKRMADMEAQLKELSAIVESMKK